MQALLWCFDAKCVESDRVLRMGSMYSVGLPKSHASHIVSMLKRDIKVNTRISIINVS